MEYPIDETYPAVYRDAHGTEPATLHNDGQELRMTVRGVTFVGYMVDDFQPLDGTPADRLAPFTLYRGVDLYGYGLEYQCPVSVVARGDLTEATLTVFFSLGVPTARGGADHETLALELLLNGKIYRNSGKNAWFDDRLLDLQAQLPDDTHLRTCVTCAYSGYGIGGYGLFGCLACFRDNKATFLQAKTRTDLWKVWDTRTEWVQETYHCPEWERRRPSPSYQG